MYKIKWQKGRARKEKNQVDGHSFRDDWRKANRKNMKLVKNRLEWKSEIKAFEYKNNAT